MRQVLLLLLAGCSTTAHHAVTGELLEHQPHPIHARVAVTRFTYEEHQVGDAAQLVEEGPNGEELVDWLGEMVAERLPRSGFEEPVAAGEPTDYRVRGYVERFRSDLPAAQDFWLFTGSILQFATLLPMYFEGAILTQVVVAVFDAAGQLLVLRKTPIELRTRSAYALGASFASVQVVADTAADEIAQAVRSVLDGALAERR